MYRWTFLPFVFVDKLIQLAFQFFWHFLPLFWASNSRTIRSNFGTQKLTQQLLKISGGTLDEQFGTKSNEFVRALAEGRCKLAPAITCFEGPRVVFEDGSHFMPDLVIFCTGFETRILYFDSSLVAAPRLLHTFCPEIGAGLGFIGFVRPAVGAIPPLAELQARWFALVQSGRVALPSETEMRRAIEYWTHFRSHIFRAVKGRLEHLVDYTTFCDELASRIGCKPALADIRRESGRFRRRFIAGPFVAAQYRLVGPHAKPEVARGVIEKLPIAHPWPYFINLHLRWRLSRALHRLAGPAFAPKLELR